MGKISIHTLTNENILAHHSPLLFSLKLFRTQYVHFSPVGTFSLRITGVRARSRAPQLRVCPVREFNHDWKLADALVCVQTAPRHPVEIKLRTSTSTGWISITHHRHRRQLPPFTIESKQNVKKSLQRLSCKMFSHQRLLAVISCSPNNSQLYCAFDLFKAYA